MAKTTRPWEVFPIKPVVSAIALVCSGVAGAEEKVPSLPEVKVEAQKETEYKVERSANQKFTAPLLDTPKSITVITQQLMKDSGSQTLQEALRMTPGITFGGGEGGIAIGDRPFIRGFDTFSSFYVDGLRDLGTQAREVFAIEQMEVVKGPSGAIDGRGSAGGSINIVTKQARAGNFVAGTAGLGTNDYKRGTLDVNRMIHDNIAVRLVGMAHKSDTPGRDFVGVQRWGLMPSITLGLNTATTAAFSYYHHETDDISDWGNPFLQNAANGSVPEGKPIGSRSAWYGVRGRDFHRTSADIGTAKLQHVVNDNFVVRNTTRNGVTTNEFFVTRPGINDAQLLAGTINRTNSRNRGTTTDTIANLTDISLSFDTWFVKHNVNAGFEFSWEETQNRAFTGGGLGTGDQNVPIGVSDPFVAFNPVTRNTHPSYVAKAFNKSAYVFDSMYLTEQLIFNGGIRFDNYTAEIQNRNTTTGANTTHFKNDKSFVNYQAGLVYKVQPNTSVYATYATSSSPVGLSMGDFNYAGGGLDAQTQHLKPESTRTFEGGIKWNTLQDLSVTLAGFHTVKTNARVNVGPAIENAGEAEVNGFELGLAGKITEKWNVFGGYTFLDARQTKAGTNPDPNQVGAADTKGKQLHGIAAHSASLWSTYRVFPRLTVGGGTFYMSRVYSDPSNNGHVPGWVRFDIMAKYNINQRLDLQLNVQNLTDRRYYNTTYFRHYAVPAAGRFAFMTLNFKF
jgi:catecholate siderophore receptor